jgi:hypothetical protein
MVLDHGVWRLVSTDERANWCCMLEALTGLRPGYGKGRMKDIN